MKQKICESTMWLAVYSLSFTVAA